MIHKLLLRAIRPDSLNGYVSNDYGNTWGLCYSVIDTKNGLGLGICRTGMFQLRNSCRELGQGNGGAEARILRLCKQINIEASEAFYASNAFRLVGPGQDDQPVFWTLTRGSSSGVTEGYTFKTSFDMLLSVAGRHNF